MVILLDITEVLSGNASVSHEGPSHPTRKVRLAYGPTLDPFSRCMVSAKLGSIDVLCKVLISFVYHRILLISNDINDAICPQIRFPDVILDSMLFGFRLYPTCAV